MGTAVDLQPCSHSQVPFFSRALLDIPKMTECCRPVSTCHRANACADQILAHIRVKIEKFTRIRSKMNGTTSPALLARRVYVPPSSSGVTWRQIFAIFGLTIDPQQKRASPLCSLLGSLQDHTGPVENRWGNFTEPLV